MRNLLLSSAAAVFALSWSGHAAAQDEGAASEARAQSADDGADPESLYLSATVPNILVSASRSRDSDVTKYTGSATVVTRDDIAVRQVRDIAEVLRDVPGVAVSETAGQTQIRLRGSEANHVLVLVDGIEVSDPFAGEFDISTLQAEIGSSLEVLRGAQSALYGSDAVGGVVAYNTASGSELGGFAARVEGGTQDTVNAAARFGASGSNWDAALSANLVSTDGQPNARGGIRDIGRDSYTVSGKGAVDLSENFELRAVARYVQTEGQFNNSEFDTTSPNFGLIVDSPDTRFETEAFYALVGARLELLDGDWTHDLSGQIADVSRDTFGAFGRSSGSEGERLKASYLSGIQFGGGPVLHQITFAADWERESFRNTDPSGFAFTGERDTENTGLVGEYRLSVLQFELNAALRHDINDRFSDATTFRVGAGYDFLQGTRIRAAAGSGIKNPGFFELFGFVDGQFIGNPDLEPEQSTGWEVGVDQDIADGAVRLSATYFESELENEIFTSFPPPSFTATPGNRETDSERRGIELSARARLGPRFSLDAAYTYLDSEEDGVEEVRRPGNIASAALTWTAPEDAASATLIVRHNGSTDDLAFTDPSFVPVRVRLDDYTLVNLAGEVKLSDNIRAFGRIENLLGDRYEQVFSFVSPGRSALIGVEARF